MIDYRKILGVPSENRIFLTGPHVKAQFFVPSNNVTHFIRRNLMKFIGKKKAKQIQGNATS